MKINLLLQIIGHFGDLGIFGDIGGFRKSKINLSIIFF